MTTRNVGSQAARAMYGFIAACSEIAREYGRCLWCGFVFCEHETTFSSMYYRVCLLEDKP